jgi:hypothetical protein
VSIKHPRGVRCAKCGCWWINELGFFSLRKPGDRCNDTSQFKDLSHPPCDGICETPSVQLLGGDSGVPLDHVAHRAVPEVDVNPSPEAHPRSMEPETDIGE